MGAVKVPRTRSFVGRSMVVVYLVIGTGVIANIGGPLSSVSAAKSGQATSSKATKPPKVSKSKPPKASKVPNRLTQNRPDCSPSFHPQRTKSARCSSDTPADTRPPLTTTPADTRPPLTTTPADTRPPSTTTPEPYQQDIFRDICVPMSWANCAEYNIYNSEGVLVNRVIGNSDWTTSYIASLSGGGLNGSAVKVREIFPLNPR
jgi:hypothetical protein